MLGQILGDIAKRSNQVQVTVGAGKAAYSINPEKIHLLMMGGSYYTYVVDYIAENDLINKFAVYEASIQIGINGDKDEESTVESLVLVMLSDEVLFEYKLSNKIEKLIENIRIYAYQREVKDTDGEE